MKENSTFYQTEINFGFFGMDKKTFYDTIFLKILKCSLSDEFSIKDINTYKKKYSIATFEKKKNTKNNDIKEDEDDINKIMNNIKINLNCCGNDIDENDKDPQYIEFLKSKLDYYFFFNI